MGFDATTVENSSVAYPERYAGGDLRAFVVVAAPSTEMCGAIRVPAEQSSAGATAAEPAICSPEEFTALIKAELGKWAKAVKDSGAKLE